MKITIKKNVSLNTAIVYMKIKKNILREDIQKYIKGQRFNDNLINNRINNYLKDINIYDEAMNLTSLGIQVKESGKLPTYEEGKYKIWFTNDNEYFGNMVVFFRRERALENGRFPQPLKLNLSKTCIILPARVRIKEKTEVNDLIEVELLDKEIYGEILNNPREKITATIIFEEGKQSQCSFFGKFGKDNAIELTDGARIKLQEQFNDVITEILPDFDTQYHRLKVEFNPEQKKFTKQNHQCSWKKFEGTVDRLDLMPINAENAKNWRDCLLRDEVSQRYLSPDDFESKAAEINDSKAFEKYKNDLPVPKSIDFKSNSTTEFWHLMAPIDLNSNH